MIGLIEEYPLTIGTLMTLTGLIWLFLRLKKKESFHMKYHGLASWGELVGTWSVMLILIIWGLIILFRAI
ncbi:hypothetical protein FGF1_36810 [Flavobacteriaceae bacterium GF1]